MRRLAMGAAALAVCAMGGAAAGQQTGLPEGVPLNQVMPQLPPVPEPPTRLPKQSHQPCANARAQVPVGDTTVATRATQTPYGIGLYGGEEPETGTAAQTGMPCPPQ